MVVAVLTAALVYSIQLDFMLFLKGFVSIALLWSGLYALNDFTDWRQDAKHAVKKERPIPSGRVKPWTALFFSLLLIIVSFIIAFSINVLIVFAWFGMLLNQFLYTMKPFELKKWPFFDLVSGSLVNPILRFYFGWLLFLQEFNAPLIVLLFVLGIQFGGYGLYRMMSKGFEKEQKMKSSVIVFGEKNIKTVFYFSIFVGLVSYFIASITVWGVKFLFLGLLSLLALPLYYNALKQPEQAEMRKMYKIIYFHNLLFIAGFVLFYFLF